MPTDSTQVEIAPFTSTVKPERASPTSSASSTSRDSPFSPKSHRSRSPLTMSPTGYPSERLTPTPTHKTPPPMMNRNYSDFIRSLAAKYNNNNNTIHTNECFTGANGYMRSYESRYPCKPPNSPFNPSNNREWDTTRKIENHPTLPPQVFPGAFPFTGFGGFSMIDMSSTQALLHMVRSAQGENPAVEHNNNSAKKSTLKRPHEPKADPLDLSSPTSKATKSSDSRGDLSSLPLSIKDSYAHTPVPYHPFYGKLDTLLTPQLYGQDPSPILSQNLCSSAREELEKWSIEDVCRFVSSIDLCSEYVQLFRDHYIDGSILPLLTEDHLINKLQMKLGPALKLKSVLAKRLGSCSICIQCIHCHSKDDKTAFRTSSVV